MLRLVLVGYAFVVNVVQWGEYARPLLGWLVFAAIAVWSAIATWFYAVPRRRYRWVLAIDVAVALGGLLLTPVVQGDLAAAEQAASVPSYWIAAPVLACAIRGGWQGGLIVAVVVGVVDISVRAEVIQRTLGNTFLLCLAAVVVGYSAALVRSAAAERTAATALSAATAERERIARAVHDGVLQVLAYVQRRGSQIGGPTRELADLAGEQEAALRALIREQAAEPDTVGDVAALLQPLAGASVSVATPGTAVQLPAPAASELVAAVREAVLNAREHAADAPVYVLVEDEVDAVTVSVRDDGPGIPEGRLDQAAANGRLGVRHSIVGRVEGLGGTATLHTGAGGGTEWELRVPRTLPP